MNDSNYTGNISTIVKYISMLLAGYLISALAAKGFNLNIPQSMLSELIGAAIFLILAHIDATHPNTFKILGNQNLNQNLNQNTTEIPDLDPAGEYETGDEKNGGS